MIFLVIDKHSDFYETQVPQIMAHVSTFERLFPDFLTKEICKNWKLFSIKISHSCYIDKAFFFSFSCGAKIKFEKNAGHWFDYIQNLYHKLCSIVKKFKKKLVESVKIDWTHQSDESIPPLYFVTLKIGSNKKKKRISSSKMKTDSLHAANERMQSIVKFGRWFCFCWWFDNINTTFFFSMCVQEIRALFNYDVKCENVGWKKYRNINKTTTVAAGHNINSNRNNNKNSTTSIMIKQKFNLSEKRKE